MPTLSLFELCKRQAGRIIHQTDDLGSMPYRLARPLLLKVHNAEQLHRIEENSPQFIGETREIWLDLIKRDIPGWRNKLEEPKNPAKWYKVYRKLVKETDKEVDEDALILQATLKNLEEEKQSRTSKVVDARTMPKIPRYGMPKAPLVRKGQEKPAELRFTSGSKTKMVTGRGVIERAKREARERMHFSSKNAILAKPTHMLNSRATTVRQAPQGLIEGHRRPLNSVPTAERVKVIAPRSRNTAGTSSVVKDPSAPRKYTQEEREARLKAISAGKPPPAQSAPPSTASSSRPRPSSAASTFRLRPPGSSRASSPSPLGQKRKREEKRSSRVDNLFDDDDNNFPLPRAETAPNAASKASKMDAARKPASTSASSSPAKRPKTGSPLPNELPVTRPRATVLKADVDIFMKKPRRPVR